MKEIIKQDTLKFFRDTNQKITAKALSDSCNEDFEFWLDESDGVQFSYVASYLGWSCFWFIEQ